MESLVKCNRRLKRDRILAIALSAHGRAEDLERSLETGFRAHITKPVEPSELIALVAGLVAENE